MHNPIQSFKAVDDTSALPPSPGLAVAGLLAGLAFIQFLNFAVSHVRSLFALDTVIILYKQSIHPQAKPNE
jgi:hypothetical protein